MKLPLPPEYPINQENYSVWLDFLYEKLPTRYQSGYSAAWAMIMKGIMGDTIEQATEDALLLPDIDHPNSPSDVLKYIATENGILRYAGETETSWRTRISNFWEYTPSFGTSEGLKTLLELFGIGTVTIHNRIPGTTENIPAPKLNDRYIPAYPGSNEHWSEFIVVFKCAKRTSGTNHNESDIVSDIVLTTIRNFIQFYKPVDWICREIVLIYNTSLAITEIWYDQPRLNYYNGTDIFEPLFMDEDEILSRPSASFIYERHICDLRLLEQ